MFIRNVFCTMIFILRHPSKQESPMLLLSSSSSSDATFQQTIDYSVLRIIETDNNNTCKDVPFCEGTVDTENNQVQTVGMSNEFMSYHSEPVACSDLLTEQYNRTKSEDCVFKTPQKISITPNRRRYNCALLCVIIYLNFQAHHNSPH